MNKDANAMPRARLTTDIERWLRGPTGECSLAAQGLLLRMRMMTCQTDNPGLLPADIKSLSQAAVYLARKIGELPEAVQMPLAELLDRSALQWSDDGRLLDPELCRDASRKASVADRVRRCRQKKVTDQLAAQADSAPPKALRNGGCNALRNAKTSVTPPVTSGVTDSPSPPLVSSPLITPLLPYPSSPPLSFSSKTSEPPQAVAIGAEPENGIDGSPAAGMRAGKARSTGRRSRSAAAPRILTPEQEETRRAFGDWWCGIWPRFHAGQLFEFVGARDGPAILELMRRQLVDWDLDVAREVAEFYLREPEIYYVDHPLWPLARKANYFVRVLNERRTKGDRYVLHRQPGAGQPARRVDKADPGKYDVPPIPVFDGSEPPVVRRSSAG